MIYCEVYAIGLGIGITVGRSVGEGNREQKDPDAAKGGEDPLFERG